MNESIIKETAPKDEFGFIYKKCSLHKAVIQRLLSIDEFRNALKSLVDKNITICNKTIFETIISLYQEMSYNRRSAEYKEWYIESFGLEGWKEFKSRYRVIASANRSVRKICKDREV